MYPRTWIDYISKTASVLRCIVLRTTQDNTPSSPWRVLAVVMGPWQRVQGSRVQEQNTVPSLILFFVFLGSCENRTLIHFERQWA